MNKPLTPFPKARDTIEKLPAKRPPRKRLPKKQPKAAPQTHLRHTLLLITAETLALACIAIYGIVVTLGYASTWFSGTSLMGSLLPFAAGVAALILAASACLFAWWKFRGYVKNYSSIIPAVIALALVMTVAFMTDLNTFNQSLSRFRTLVGGKAEASRVTLNHQVFAAYRRHNANNLNKMMMRAEPYRAVIEEAASEFDIDRDLLHGIAATESSFLPRDSHDGGRGLFQITAVPKNVLEDAKTRLKVGQLSLADPKHNAFIAAATFKHYLAEMRGDVFLGLLAYNIGPANGGLRFIMKKYGVTDFITIQPYLQLLPRDYPIRVLTYGLAFRLWQKEGKLPAYEEGDNAMQIQRIGIPGLP